MYSLAWFAALGLLLAGIVLFVVALVRWQMNSWKYVLLAVMLVLPPVAGVAGWIALFAGGTKQRKPPTVPLPPPHI